MKNADVALYRAESEGRGRFAFFEPQWNSTWSNGCGLGVNSATPSPRASWICTTLDFPQISSAQPSRHNPENIFPGHEA
jgi:hypothetical protein